jgi:hypothetical protein
MTPEEVAASFVEAINAQKIDELSELMTENHVFVDSDGTEVSGRQRMREGWKSYFAMVPDYEILVKETFSRAETVVFLGVAQGTFSQGGALRADNHWSVPAAWRAVVEGSRVAVWQLYVNPEPMQRIVERIRS